MLMRLFEDIFVCILWTFKLPFLIHHIMEDKDLNFMGALNYINLQMGHELERLETIKKKIETKQVDIIDGQMVANENTPIEDLCFHCAGKKEFAIPRKTIAIDTVTCPICDGTGLREKQK